MMTKRSKIRVIALSLFAVLCGLTIIFPPTPADGFMKFFARMSIGIPEHQAVLVFQQPADAVKGDYFTAVFTQSEDQFHRFAATLRVSDKQLLTAAGATVAAQSGSDLNDPWLLTMTAEITNAPQRLYRVKIEGRQGYNQAR